MKSREELYSLLGILPPRQAPLSYELIFAEEREDYWLEKWIFQVNEAGEALFNEPVPAYFARPKKAAEGPLPAVLFCHSHGGQYDLGKEELLKGNHYMYEIPYAKDLVKAGFAVLSFDAWGFGERHTRSESEIFKDMLWQGEVLWGHMVYDGLRAFDFLSSRPEVDPQRIATLGMSMGSTLAWWLFALEERIKACADLCCITDIDTLAERGGFDLHGLYYYVPGLRRHFSTSDILALGAPRPHLSCVGLLDPLTPAEGVDRIEEELSRIYRENSASAFEIRRYPVAHQETNEMRRDVLAFLKRWF